MAPDPQHRHSRVQHYEKVAVVVRPTQECPAQYIYYPRAGFAFVAQLSRHSHLCFQARVMLCEIIIFIFCYLLQYSLSN